MANCPCGNPQSFDKCCGPYIRGEKKAPTAEALMRSRYSAYATQAIDYIEQSHEPTSREDFDRAAATAWSEQTDWLGLEIRHTEAGGLADETGSVEFVARFRTGGAEQTHHEHSVFKKIDDTWYYLDGRTVRTPVVRAEPKLGRNDPCSCGSGKKFKKCCAA